MGERMKVYFWMTIIFGAVWFWVHSLMDVMEQIDLQIQEER